MKNHSTSCASSSLFSGTPFTQHLSEAAQQKLERHIHRLTPKQGETVIYKGDAMNGVFLVESGKLRVYTLDSNGNEKPIYHVTSGDLCVFSINCIFSKMLYPAWVQNESEDTRIMSIPASIFQELYEEELSVRDYVVNSLSTHIFNLMSSLEEVSIHDVGQRINSYLVRACPEDHVLHISHQDIAQHLGTAREVVSRHLKSLEKAGYIELSRMKIKILSSVDLAAL